MTQLVQALLRLRLPCLLAVAAVLSVPAEAQYVLRYQVVDQTGAPVLAPKLTFEHDGTSTQGAAPRRDWMVLAVLGTNLPVVPAPSDEWRFERRRVDSSTANRAFVVVDLVLEARIGPVSGAVTSNGRPVRGVDLQAFNDAGASLTNNRAESGADGTYTIPDVRQVVTVRPTATVTLGQKTYDYSFTPVQSGPVGSGRDRVNFAVTRGPLGGRIVTGDGGGVAGIDVLLLDRGGSELARTRSDAQGEFGFGDLDARRFYTVRAQSPGFDFGAALETRFVGETDLELHLRKGSIRGVAEGPPGAGVDVTLVRSPDDAIVARSSVAAGEGFEFSGLLPDTYRLRAKGLDPETGTEIPYEDRPAALGENVTMSAPGYLRGAVRSGGAGVAGARVRARPSAGGAALSAVTGPGGKYLLIGVARDADYELEVEAEDAGTRFTPAPAARSALRLRERAGIDGLDFEATKAIRGRIVLADDETRGVGGVEVVVDGRPGVTDDEGAFAIEGFALSDARLLEVEPESDGFRLDPPKISVRPGDRPVRFRATGGAWGRITYADGTGAAGIRVRVRSERDLSFGARTADTDEHGRYFVSGAKPDLEYEIVPESASFEFQPEERTVKGSQQAQFRVRRSPPTVSPLDDLLLPRGADPRRVHFRVSDRETPAEQLRVQASSSDGVVSVSRLDALEDGHWSLALATEPRSGSADVTVIVRDGDFASTSASFSVSVGTLPLFEVQELGAASRFDLLKDEERVPRLELTQELAALAGLTEDPPPAPSEQDERTRVLFEANVLAVERTPAPGRVRLNRGRRDGLEPGVVFRVRRANRVLGTVEVEEVDDNMSRATILETRVGATIHQGDVAEAFVPRFSSPSGTDWTVFGRNARGEFVGSYVRGEDGSETAFYYPAGFEEPIDLSDLALPGTTLSPRMAGAVREDGTILGLATREDGTEVVFRASPVVLVGSSVPRPNGAVAEDPRESLDEAQKRAFFWSQSDRKLYALAPTEAELRWRTTPVTTDPTDRTRLSQRVRTEWPRDPQLHVVGAPVEVEPTEVEGFPYTFLKVAHSECRLPQGKDLHPGEFVALSTGHSVLQYYLTNGERIDPLRQRPFFQVVRSLDHDDPAFVDRTQQFVPVGTAVRPRARFSAARLETPGFGNDILVEATEPGDEYDGLAVRVSSFRTGTPGADGADVAFDAEANVLHVTLPAQGVLRDELVDAINAGLSQAGLSRYRARAAEPDSPGDRLSLPALPPAFLRGVADLTAGDCTPVIDPFNGSAPAAKDFSWTDGDEITVEFWIQAPEGTQRGRFFALVEKNGPEGEATVTRFSIEDVDRLTMRADDLLVQGTDVSVADGNWHHVAVSWRSTTGEVRVYVDGVRRFEGEPGEGRARGRKEGILTGRPILRGFPARVVLGHDMPPIWPWNRIEPVVSDGPSEHVRFRGRLDELRVWNRVLSSEEIASRWARKLDPAAERGLVSYTDWEATTSRGDFANVVAGGPTASTPCSGRADEPIPAGLEPREWVAVTAGGWRDQDDFEGRNAFVLGLDHARIDALGEDAAYDANERLGPILPVNEDTLELAWYRRNELGVAWPDNPQSYSVRWPEDDEVDAIVLADQPRASALVPDAEFPEKRIYRQPDRDRAGHNPNEEHALLVGETVAALRVDLNDEEETSKPYVLLKYRDPLDAEWRMKVYRVVAEDDRHGFHYLRTAGTELQPPFPLNNLPLCPPRVAHEYGALWTDVKGKRYAFAAGPGGTDGLVSVRYSYPVQPGFDVPVEDGEQPSAPGDCIAWLNDYESTTPLPVPHDGSQVAPSDDADDPINVYYTVSWPQEIPSIGLAESLSTARDGLPEIWSQARAEVVYEASNPEGSQERGAKQLHKDAAVRIYDPISERSVELAGGLPDGIETFLETDGRKTFPKLPFHLRVRVLLDDLNPDDPKLIFRGYELVKGQPPGRPLLLPNVMSAAERALLQELDDAGSAAWTDAVTKLYDAARNPNRVRENEREPAAGGTGVSTGLLVGMTRGYVTRDGRVLRSAPEDPRDRERTTMIPDSLGGGPKVLSTAFPSSPEGLSRLVTDVRRRAVTFSAGNRIGGSLETEAGVVPDFGPFTIELWLRKDAGQREGDLPILSQVADDSDDALTLAVRPDDSLLLNGEHRLENAVIASAKWQHLALVRDAQDTRVYLDGELADSLGEPIPNPSPRGRFDVGGPLRLSADCWQGRLREVRVWQSARTQEELLQSAQNARFTGREPGLVGYWTCAEGYGMRTTFDRTGRGRHMTLLGMANFVEDEEPTTRPNGYVTLAFNNDADLPGLPVDLSILLVEPRLAAGDVRVIPSDNIFDERLTLRQSLDFGGATDSFEFEWRYHRGSNPPLSDSEWLSYGAPAAARNQLTLGEGGESGALVISDNGWMMRYRPVDSSSLAELFPDGEGWTEWVGAPGLVPPQPQLAEGWIKRVTRALNPFDARTDDFRSSAVNTYASLLVSAGRRYEGDIAFNPDADNVNKIGLIEAYETVLRRGLKLSEGVENDEAVNQALLLATGKISDLYVLLGNEAFADSQDPTIGFTTPDGAVGSLAPSIFAFQNQLPSLLEEELALLRGIDSTSGAPAYNRLRWNMTSGEGQLAYVQVYDVRDTQTRDMSGAVIPPDGFIDATDAAFLYPQAHGDAWGHYLTAVRKYYDLLNRPGYRWVPRTERVLLAGVPIEVDYLDERRFAAAAAARARSGVEIAALTYRQQFDPDPRDQFQGYPDRDPERAWGVSEWSRRAAQGAYFDWLVGNAILPDTDPDERHEGIERIDRGTIAELAEIASAYDSLQAQEDAANAGLNPLGLVDGALAFDIDPRALDGAGQTQFEQIAARADKAMANAVTVFNYANDLTNNLRRTQDSATSFASNVEDQEADFTNRLIEVFGYPYAGDMGPGKPYSDNYSGPDLIHYNYVPASKLTGEAAPSVETVTAYFDCAQAQVRSLSDLTRGTDGSETSIAGFRNRATLEVQFPVTRGKGWRFEAPPEWGERRAPGEIQVAISDLLQAQGAYRRALEEYGNHLATIRDKVADVESTYDLNTEKLGVLNWERDSTIAMNTAIGALTTTEKALRRTSAVVEETFEAAEEGVPRVVGFSNDVTSTIRGLLKGSGVAATQVLETAADAAELSSGFIGLGKEQLGQDANIRVFELDARAEVEGELGELEQLLRAEAPMRIGLQNQREVVHQALSRYRMTLQRGLRLLEQRESFRRKTAGNVSLNRYRDMTFRVFRNDAIQKYRAQFDVAARYVFLAAKAYDYETTLLRADDGAGRRFFDDIVRERALGEWVDGRPLAGRHGLADSLARLTQNFDVLKGQLGLNNQDREAGVFSLKNELFRIAEDEASGVEAPPGDLDRVLGTGAPQARAVGLTWQQVLSKYRVEDLWAEPAYRRMCRPFAPESLGPQPALVIPFSTTVTAGRNLFGWPLAGGESSFDASQFATKIRSVGLVFEGYPEGLSRTPRAYLIPLGTDILRSAAGDTTALREFRIVDQKIPVPFPIGPSDLNEPGWIPEQDGLAGTFADVRRYSTFRAHGVAGSVAEALDPWRQTSSSRLIGRSVWNTSWLLIVPGGTMLGDPNEALDLFVSEVDDIELTLETYASSGN